MGRLTLTPSPVVRVHSPRTAAGQSKPRTRYKNKSNRTHDDDDKILLFIMYWNSTTVVGNAVYRLINFDLNIYRRVTINLKKKRVRRTKHTTDLSFWKSIVRVKSLEQIHIRSETTQISRRLVPRLVDPTVGF